MKFELKPEDKIALEKLVRSGMTPVIIVQRARIYLLKDEGKSNYEIADELGVNRHTVDLWVKKYRDRNEDDTLEELLNVSPGRGRKEEVTGEAKAWLISIACTQPNKYGDSPQIGK